MTVHRNRFGGWWRRAALGLGCVAVALVVFPAAALSAASSSLTVSGTVLATSGEPSPAGVATARCVDGGTLYSLHFTGLSRKAVYTVWGIVFTTGPNGISVGSLGQTDGSQSVFRASAAGVADFSLLVPGGGQTSFGLLGVPGFDSGAWPTCMIGNGLLIIDGHTDGLTHGGVPGSGYPADPFADAYDLMEFDLF